MADNDMTFKTWCIGRHIIDVPARFEPLENYGTINTMRVERLGPSDSGKLDAFVRQWMRDLTSGAVAEEGVPLVFRGSYREGNVHVLAHELELGQTAGTAYTWTEEAYVAQGGFILRVTQVLSEDDETDPRAQMLDLAGRITPYRRDDPAEGPGACLPDAIAHVPVTSELHGMTFVPHDAEGAPVGLEIAIVSRSPLDPPLDPDLPSGPTARSISFAGMSGTVVDDPDNFGPSILAVVSRPASVDRPALRIQIYYYDERPASEAPPDAQPQAQAVFERAINSIRERTQAE